MWPTHGGFGGFVLLYALIWIAIVVIVLTSLWRGMRALDRIAASLADHGARKDHS